MLTFPKLRDIFTSESESRKDILQVALSDFHTGSNYALFPNRVWHGTKENTHAPTSNQQRIYEHFIRCAEWIRIARQNKQVKLIHNGDAIDGDHHNSGDVCTRNALEQADLHIELMIELQRLIDWRAGDELYYTRGTQTHVNEFENYIGEQLDAKPDGEFYVHDLLKLESNGVWSWFVHHGPGVGKGANETNGLYNWLKGIYYDALKDGARIPDVIYSGHVHQPTYAPFGYRLGMTFLNMHGVILPSWQMKTIFARAKAPVNKNKIGGVIHEIKADGTITIPQFCVMETE